MIEKSINWKLTPKQTIDDLRKLRNEIMTVSETGWITSTEYKFMVCEDAIRTIVNLLDALDCPV